MPTYAKDIKFNLSNIANSTALTKQQIWGAILTSALASRNGLVIESVAAEAAESLSAEADEAAKAAAAVMAMNNIYYRSIHLIEDSELSKMPARLRMNIIRNPGVDKLDFELWSLVASFVNGCGMCLKAHAHEVRPERYPRRHTGRAAHRLGCPRRRCHRRGRSRSGGIGARRRLISRRENDEGEGYRALALSFCGSRGHGRSCGNPLF